MPGKTIVSTIFSAKDKMSIAFKKMSAGAKKFGNVSDAAFKKASRSAIKFRSIAGGILVAGLVSKGVMLAKQALGALTAEFISFEGAATRAAAKFPEGIKKGTKAFRELELAARKLGATTQFTATEAAQGLEFLAMAGFDAKQAIAVLPGTVDLATNANMDLARSTDIASDALGAFNMMSKDTSVLTKNFTRINDVFTKTINTANVDMENLFETMKDGAPVMTAAGQSIETFAALTGVMGNATIKGTKAGTTLKNAVLNLVSPVGKGKAAIKAMGLQIKDSSGNMRDIIDIIADVEKKTQGMGNAQKSATIETIFGRRAVAGMNVLLAKGSEGLREYRTTLQNAKGAAAAMASEIRGSLENRIKALKSALIEAGFKVFDVFQKGFPNALDAATEAIRNFNVQPIIDGLKTILALGKKLYDWGNIITPIIAGITAGFIAFKVAATAIAIKAFVAGLVAMTVAAGGAATVMGVLTTAMLANPAVAIGAAIALLITGIVLLVKNWDKVKAAFFKALDFIKVKVQKVFSFIKTKLKQAWQWFSKLLDNPFFAAISTFLLPWLTIPALIVKHWEKIKTFFAGVWGFLKDSFWSAFSFIKTKLDEAWQWFSKMLENPFFTTIAAVLMPIITIPALIVKHWEPIKGFFVGLWEGVIGIFNEAVLVMESVFQSIGDTVTGIFNSVKSVFQEVVGFISEKLNWLIDKFQPFLQPLLKILDKVGAGVGAGISAGGSIVDTAIAAGKGMVNEVMGRGEKERGIVAPNQAEVATRNELKGSFSGKLSIEGAPPGSRLEQKSTGTPRITAELGAN